jgi:hypothetical protein
VFVFQSLHPWQVGAVEEVLVDLERGALDQVVGLIMGQGVVAVVQPLHPLVRTILIPGVEAVVHVDLGQHVPVQDVGSHIPEGKAGDKTKSLQKYQALKVGGKQVE